MAESVLVCRLDDLVEGRARRVEAAGRAIALYRVGDSVFALSARCPHAGGDLGSGWLEEGEAICPLHRWRFRLSDGRCTSVRGESVSRLECEVGGGGVWVEV